VVQDPEDAMFPSMPLAAIALTEPDCIVPVSEMADALCALVEHVASRRSLRRRGNSVTASRSPTPRRPR